MKTVEYLSALKAKLNIQSDYALAKHLGVARQAVSHYANGVRTFDNSMAAKVAEILDVPVVKVIADMELERGTNDALWKRIRAAAVIVAAVGAGSAIALNYPEAELALLASIAPNPFVLCKIKG